MTTHFFGDTAVLLGRSLRHITRSLDTIITTGLMPIAFLLLFVYVLGGAINSGSHSYVSYLLPGILLITIASGISYTSLPTDTMPGPVRTFAEHQPVTSIVNAIRDLFTQQPVGADTWIALGWCAGILIVAYIFAMVSYRRKIA